jgi:hypothetical protein
VSVNSCETEFGGVERLKSAQGLTHGNPALGDPFEQDAHVAFVHRRRVVLGGGRPTALRPKVRSESFGPVGP